MEKLSGEEFDELMRYIEQVVEDAAARVLYESQQIVPVDTGRLKNSGRLNPLVRDENGVECSVSYHTNYAFWVHERTDIAHHNPPGARAKFLEEPVSQIEPDFARSLRNALERYFRE